VENTLYSNIATEGESISELNLDGGALLEARFEVCEFSSCDFSSATLNRCAFIECTFENCNFSNTDFKFSKLIDCEFTLCKLLGVDWTKVLWPDLQLSAPLVLSECILDNSSFLGLSLPGLKLSSCRCHEVDFRDADLSSGDFIDCDFELALFANTNLKSANFRGAYNYTIDIRKNNITQGKFSKLDALGLLAGLDIELCD